MSKPTKAPRWGDVSGDIVEPSEAKKDVGWADEERPPAQFWNWLQNLTSDWCTWLLDGTLGRASLTDKTPVLAFCDQDDRERVYVDPMGLFGGPAVNDHYVPRDLGSTIAASQTNVEVAPGLAVSTDTNAVAALVDAATSDPGHPIFQLTTQNAATKPEFAGLHTQGAGGSCRIIGNVDDQVAVAEARVSLETVGANEVDIFFGLHSSPEVNSSSFESAASFAFAMFEKLSADTNWQMSVGNIGSGTSSDSGTPPVAGAFQTLRVEYHGLNTPVGVDAAAAVARFFIDGAFEGEVTTNVPVGARTLGFVARVIATGTGPAADLDMEVGPVRVGYVTTLDADPPQT